MIIQEETKSRTHPEENGVKMFLQEPLRASSQISRLESRADGGVKFVAEYYGEFDNYFKLTIDLDREDMDEIKRMISLGLI